MGETRTHIGIRSIASYVPPAIRDSHYIAQASGIPEYVIREKFGIKQVHKADENDTVSSMAVKASQKALEGIDPDSLDMVVYCGSEYKDFYLFNCAARVKEVLGAKRAEAFELHVLCAAGVYGLKVLKAMMLQDPRLNRVLLVSSSKEGDLINYQDSDSRFMFNFGDGAAAVVLEKNWGRNEILDTAMISDGQFAQDVYLPGVGCVNRDGMTDISHENAHLRVLNLQNMKERLDPVSLANFCSVMDQAVERSGFTGADVGFVAPIAMKKSMLMALLDHFSLTEENSFLLEDYGHCQSADCFLAMEEGLRHGRLHDGDLVVAVAAGTGYTWASTIIRWGDVVE